MVSLTHWRRGPVGVVVAVVVAVVVVAVVVAVAAVAGVMVGIMVLAAAVVEHSFDLSSQHGMCTGEPQY